jgi:type IV secretory pathway VirB10-like protein
LSKSNTCPICGIQFYKKESQLNRLVKESISYVSDIIRLTSLTITNDEITDTNSLPDISLVIEEENKSIKSMLPPPPPPPPPPTVATKKLKKIQSESQFSQLTETKRATKRATNKTSSSKNRSQSVTIDLTKMAESQNNNFDATTTNSITARSSQSVKRIKKNNKGETAIHLCVMNNDLISLKDLLENDSTLDVNIKDNAGWTALHEVS